MEFHYDFNTLIKSDFQDGCDDEFQHQDSPSSPEDSGDDSIDSGVMDKYEFDPKSSNDELDLLAKALDDDLELYGYASIDQGYDSLDQLFDAESESYEKEDNYENNYLWEEAQCAAKEMHHRVEQEQLQRQRMELMRQMRANYQNATDSFSFYADEQEEVKEFSVHAVLQEEEEEWQYEFNWRAVKRAWLRDMPESVTPPSNLCIIRTCVTEPNLVEVLVDFRSAAFNI